MVRDKLLFRTLGDYKSSYFSCFPFHKDNAFHKTNTKLEDLSGFIWVFG